MRSVLFVLSIVLIGSTFGAQAKMYKWVNAEGQVVFGDKVPIEYMTKGYAELNEQGVVIKQNAAERTALQKVEDKRLAQLKKQLERAENKRKHEDRVLLDTYTTERDLVVARDARLDAVGSQIQLAESIISDSSKSIVLLENQVERITASGHDVPTDVYGRLNKEKQQIEIYNNVMAKHKKRRDEISTQFVNYIERFNALKAKQKVVRERLAIEREL